MCSLDSAEEPHVAPDPPRSLDDLEREICELGAHIEAATCRWLMLVGEFDEREGWGQWGTRSCAHWLSWRCSLAPGAARERVRVARRLRELPLVREAFAAGQLSYCKVRAITRVATPEIEAELVEIARHATGAQLEKLVRGYGGALAATLGMAQHAHEQRFLRCSWAEDGSMRIEARLCAEEAALVVAALEAAERTAPAMEPSYDADPAAARRADALVSVARSSLAAEARDRKGPDPCEVVVHVDAETLAGDEAGGRSELEDGPALAPETVRRLGCDAAVVQMVERDGRPISAGRRTRTIPKALRRALRSRDRGCCFPGCTHTRFLHAHHIHHWARGGPTTLENLVQLCSYHHRLVHEGGYQVERAGPRAICFRRPDGRRISAGPGRSRVTGPGLAQQNRARGVPIHADSCRPLSAGDPLDYGLAVEGLLARALPDP